MRNFVATLLFILLAHYSFAGRISGTISDTKGNRLGFASVTVKGSTAGVAANSEGRYALTLAPGKYTLVCQYVGFRSEERSITVGNEDLTVNFELAEQELKMQEVVIKRGEDPAIQIMKEAIRKRNFYNNQVDSFTVDVYIKGLMRSRSIPDKFMGQKIDKKDMTKDGLDSNGKGILFLSESLTKVAYSKPDKIKYEVISSKQSGGGYGLSFPFFINFYTNQVQISNTNPRGFVSPIADGAFHYYKFKYEGNFFEGDKMVDRIRVTPRRKNEPLFEGYIQIVDGEWRIHSLELTTNKTYTLELIDTLRIKQIHSAVGGDVWRTQNQVVYLAFNMFGFDITGNFLNIYSNYNLDPGFGKKYFDRIFMKYDTAANKRDSSYWANIRPVPLEPDEKQNYTFLDSVRKAERDSFSRQNLDSLRKQRKPVKLVDVFWSGGLRRTIYGKNVFITYHLKPLLKQIDYNTVEGVSFALDQTLSIRPRKGKLQYTLGLDARYGYSNQQLNPAGSLRLAPKRYDFRNRYLEFAGGRKLQQFNRDNPIDRFTNAFYTLFYRENYMKLYRASFGEARYHNKFESGLDLLVGVSYEDRFPVQNTSTFDLTKRKRAWLPNHPYELEQVPFVRHQAFVTSATVSFQPGQRYIQFPYSKMPIGSKYPTMELSYTVGLPKIGGSEADFHKWRFSVRDNMNFRMGGEFRYRLGAGGFLRRKRVDIPDFTHFNGNQTFYNSQYLNSFQLAPYYRYSNVERFYAIGHAEHHFNGLITNKIPLFNKLRWHLVGGSNAFYVNSDNYYVEAFAGLENIFKIFRVDFIAAYQAQPGNSFGIRIGTGGILGGMATRTR